MDFKEISAHLSRFRVGIAGAGGLGSNCAVALARSGVGTLVICDFDVVERSNLNRQYYFTDQEGQLKVSALKDNIKRINPSVSVITFPEKLNEMNIAGVFGNCDIVVEAFDRAEAKEMLIVTLQNKLKDIPVVVGSGLAGWGMNESIRFRKIDDKLFVCGDEASDSAEGIPLMAPRVGMVANMQANTVIEILMNIKRS